MIRKTLTILSLIGLLLSVWGELPCVRIQHRHSWIYCQERRRDLVTGGELEESGTDLGRYTRWLPSRTVLWGRINRYIPFWIPTAFFAITTSSVYLLPFHRDRRRCDTDEYREKANNMTIPAKGRLLLRRLIEQTPAAAL